MKIGIIGYGAMAKALAGKWITHHEVMLSGRNAEKAASAAQALGAQVGSPREAAAFGEVVVLATRHEDVFAAIEDAGGAAAFAGKIVLDINNPVEIAEFLSTRPDSRSLTEAIAEALPGAHVGKAFNMAQAQVWADPDMRYDGRSLVTLYTADQKAEAAIARLIADVGSDPYRIGDNRHAYKLEAAAGIVIKALFSGAAPRTVLNFIQPETKPIR